MSHVNIYCTTMYLRSQRLVCVHDSFLDGDNYMGLCLWTDIEEYGVNEEYDDNWSSPFQSFYMILCDIIIIFTWPL